MASNDVNRELGWQRGDTKSPEGEEESREKGSRDKQKERTGAVKEKQ